ncbi:hypothetical protein GEMRC1_008328 [Eukaryota sp. GEM-RC1]
MIIGLLLLSCCVLGSVFKWDTSSSGLWSEGSNWDHADSPSMSSSVVLCAQSSAITITIDDSVTISSLTLSANVVLLFRNHSTLTISDTLILTGGTFRSDPSSLNSFTSVNSLVLESDCTFLISHKLFVNGYIEVGDGVLEFDSLSVLEFVNVTNVVLENSGVLPSTLFLHYTWHDSFNTIDHAKNHDSDAIQIHGPQWKKDVLGGYLDIQSGNILRIPYIGGHTAWRDASIALWIYFESGAFGFCWNNSPCRCYITTGRFGWGSSSSTSYNVPRDQWIYLVMTFDQTTARFYVDGVLRMSFSPGSPYYHSNPPPLFPLSEMTSSSTRFTGGIRAVKIFKKALSWSEIQGLHFEHPTGIFGQGHLSFVDSSVMLLSSELYLRSLSLVSSKLQSMNLLFPNLKLLELDSDSLMSLRQNSKFLSDSLFITLNSSELHFDNSVDISSSSVSLIAINSHFQNDVDFSSIHLLNLSFSTFESACYTQVNVDLFYCFNCQLLGNSSLVIEFDCEVNSGNFSSQLKFLESVDNSSIIGQVQLSNSIDFFGHVILDDVSISEFQSSSNGSITCHSDVLIKNDVTISKVSFIYYETLTLYDSTLLFDPLFVILDYQIIRGFGSIITNTSNFGKIQPSSNFTFEENLFLSSSSIISLQINNDSSATLLIVSSTAYLDGQLEVDLTQTGQIKGRFRNVINPCASLVSLIYTRTSLIISVNDYVMELHQKSYISITGIDDPCCGSFDSPCASFRGVLERMGRNGTVYFHEGSYTFDQGLGEVHDVEWEVIALGTVMIEGIDETLFELVHSYLCLSNIDIFCFSPICFSLPDSTLQLINSSVLHDTTSTTTTLVDNPQDHWGHVSFIDSKLEFRSSLMYVSSLSLWSSTLESNNFTWNNLQQVKLDRDSLMNLIDDLKILSDSLSITLNSSELYFDDSVDITSSSFSLTTINSQFQTGSDFSHMDLLDLSCSTFKSASLTGNSC